MTSATTMALMVAATMVAMMLPSVAPTLRRHHRRLRAAQASRAGLSTARFAAGYATVWAAIALALFAASAGLSPMDMTSPMARPPVAPWAVGAVVAGAGALQRSRWKARRLLRCRDACVPAARVIAPGRVVVAAWRDGVRLGVDCALSCAAPMAVLVVAGLMDARMMAVITAAITAERVAPAGVRIARLTGAIALGAGAVICVRALAVAISGGA